MRQNILIKEMTIKYHDKEKKIYCTKLNAQSCDFFRVEKIFLFPRMKEAFIESICHWNIH